MDVLHLWVSPEDCDPPHKVGYPEKVSALQAMFLEAGWDMSHPRLVGYPLQGRIQLLSGSHRWAAAVGVLEAIPVSLVPLELVHTSWGDTTQWSKLMAVGNTAPSA